jgi:hypothetical protein
VGCSAAQKNSIFFIDFIIYVAGPPLRPCAFGMPMTENDKRQTNGRSRNRAALFLIAATSAGAAAPLGFVRRSAAQRSTDPIEYAERIYVDMLS